jgi:hypothetical protein
MAITQIANLPTELTLDAIPLQRTSKDFLFVRFLLKLHIMPSKVNETVSMHAFPQLSPHPARRSVANQYGR